MGILVLYASNVALATKRLPQAVRGKYVPRPGENRTRNVLITVDQWANAVAGGDPNETISSRAAKARNAGEDWGCMLCKVLAWIARNDHCTLALEPHTGARAVAPDAVPPVEPAD